MDETEDQGADIPEGGGPAALERGRACYRRRAWADAYEALTQADAGDGLGAADLELLARAAYLIGREDAYRLALVRAHHAHLAAGDEARAARCTFWIGLCLMLRGEAGPASGWFARGRRLVSAMPAGCAEQGYVMLPDAERHLAAHEAPAASGVAAKAAEIGERCGDPDLAACARHVMGRAVIAEGRIEQGLSLLDEAMVAVVTGELTPVMTGLIYCSVIDACQQVYALERARQWTAALAQWCAGQPQLVSFTGACLVHRAEVMELHGQWPDAIEEARRACADFPAGSDLRPPAAAFYRRGELHRLRGEFAAAETAFREASGRGCEPQPGLALLRLAQGRADAAAAAIRGALAATGDRLARLRLLPAAVEILLAAGDGEGARTTCGELGAMADDLHTEVPRAMAAQARGTVALADGDAAAALGALRDAFATWQRVEAPYQAARTRELAGLACRALGDEEGAELELAAAGSAFTDLGAAPDAARVDRLVHRAPARRPHGLTRRELQVLALVAAGRTNREIASELFVSQRTVDRHVSNVFGKLDVSTRTAAASFAHRHNLV